MKDAAYWITQLRLSPHPEGGHFGETYRSEDTLPPSGLPARYSAPRACATAIYFLLESGDVSKFHRLQSDEVWFYHAGSPLAIYMLAPDGSVQRTVLGLNLDNHECPQLSIPHGVWFAARIETEQASVCTLVSCVVAPGFQFDDFELATRAQLLATYPQHDALIAQFT